MCGPRWHRGGARPREMMGGCCCGGFRELDKKERLEWLKAYRANLQEELAEVEKEIQEAEQAEA